MSRLQIQEWDGNFEHEPDFSPHAGEPVLSPLYGVISQKQYKGYRQIDDPLTTLVHQYILTIQQILFYLAPAPQTCATWLNFRFTRLTLASQSALLPQPLCAALPQALFSAPPSPSSARFSARVLKQSRRFPSGILQPTSSSVNWRLNSSPRLNRLFGS